MTYSIEIFKTGTHTASNGVTRTYGVSDLKDVVETYDPNHFKAPLIFNYFADDPHATLGLNDREIAKSPFAFGFPDRLAVNGDRLVAHFDKISPEFVQWNRDGKILSVSASFYPENYPHNPYGDKLSLRHIAALGTEPPAVKGLTPLSLSEELEGNWALSLSEFSEESVEESEETLNHAQMWTDYSWATLKSLFQRLRDKLIADKGIDEADKIYPQFMLDALIPIESADVGDDSDDDDEDDEDDELDQEAVMRLGLLSAQVGDLNSRMDGLYQLMLSIKSQYVPGYSDQPMNQPLTPAALSIVNPIEQEVEPITMSEELNPVAVAPVAPDNKELETLRAQIAELQVQNAAKDRAAKVKEIATFAEGLASSDERKILPSNVGNEINFMVSLMDASDSTVSYSEGDSQAELTPLDAYKKMLVSRTPLWDNTKLPTEPQNAPTQYSEKDIANKARALKKKLKENGMDKSYSECIDLVTSGKDKDM